MLALTENPSRNVPLVEWLPFPMSSDHEPTDPELVRVAVMQGVAEANSVLVRKFQVAAVRHHTDHTPAKAYTLYSYLAYQLVEFAAGNANEPMVQTE